MGVAFGGGVKADIGALERGLGKHVWVSFDEPCDVRVAWCRCFEELPKLPGYADNAPQYVLLETPLSENATRGALSNGIFEVLDVGTPEERLARLRARLERRALVQSRADAVIRERGLVAHSSAMRSALEAAAAYALHSDEAILILGETGTGKEQTARLVHALDPQRCSKPFQVVDCTSLSEGLAGSELFGHERGSFTGAVSRHVGAFGAVAGGVLFLDELGELSLELQAKLLRVIQEKRFRRIGSTREEAADFRLVCATNRDLAKWVQEGIFRADLFYRVSSLSVRLPTLSRRREDVLPLARHFLREFLARADGERDPTLHPTLLSLLRARSYAGNVRELRQIMARAAANYPGAGPLCQADLDPEDRGSESLAAGKPDASGDSVRALLEREILDDRRGLDAVLSDLRGAAYEIAIEHVSGNTAAAAEVLNRSQRDVQKHIKSRRQKSSKLV